MKVSLHPAQASQRPGETRQQSYNLLAVRYCTEVDSLTGKVAPVEQSHRHLQHLLHRFFRGSRTETPQGSQLAFAPGNVATRIRPATGRHSLFPTPLPASPLVGLAASLPSFRKERYGLTTLHKVHRDVLGALCSPVLLGVHARVLVRPCAHSAAFWRQVSQHLCPVAFDDVYRESPCVHHTIHPAPSPPDAGSYTPSLAVRVSAG